MSVGTGANGSGLHFTQMLPSLDDIAVIDSTHREALSQPFELVLNLASRDGSLDATDLLDRDASLTIWQDGESLSIINTSAGFVTWPSRSPATRPSAFSRHRW